MNNVTYKSAQTMSVISDVETGKEYLGFTELANAYGVSCAALLYHRKKTLEGNVFKFKGKTYSVRKELRVIEKNADRLCTAVICYETGERFDSISQCAKTLSVSASLLGYKIQKKESIDDKHYVFERDWKPNMDFPDPKELKAEKTKNRSESLKRYWDRKIATEMDERNDKPIGKAIYQYSKYHAFPVLVLSDKSAGRTNFKVQDKERTIYYCTEKDLRNYERI